MILCPGTRSICSGTIMTILLKPISTLQYGKRKEEKMIFEDIYDQISEYDYWNGQGHIEFYVNQNVPKDELFEIDVLDYSGCAGGLQETIGIDYYIQHCWGLCDELREGVTYTIKDLTVEWTRGDGWTTDDDVEYYFKELEHDTTLYTYLSQKLKNIWWRRVVCHIRNLKNRMS